MNQNNIDKMLELLSTGNTIFCFLIVIIDLENREVNSRLVPILSDTFISMLRIQFHWAGRQSRGVTQLSGDFHNLIEDSRRNTISIENARHFLQHLLISNKLCDSPKFSGASEVSLTFLPFWRLREFLSQKTPSV